THETYDIVLSDHTLPNLSSLDVLRVCKKQNSSMPFILVSGSVSEDLAVSIIKEGADDYVLKENLKRLPVAISRAIAESERLREKELVQKQITERSLAERKLIEDKLKAKIF